LDFVGLAESVDMLERKEVSSSELVEHSLRQIEASQPRLAAFRVVRDVAARREAVRADQRRTKGERLPLLGVPIAIKDDTDITGETTPFGSRGEFDVKTRDAEIVRRLREAGAVIVGKTKCSEFGQWPTGDTEAFGVTRNPWNLDYTPGGSSSGAAAAVAAGLVPAAVGSDGAGSVRIPAAWSGLVGLKPQRGRISGWPDPDAFNGLTTNGPLGRSVDDVALLLDVLRGNHPYDTFRLSEPSQPFRVMARRPVGRLRIAVSIKVPPILGANLDPEIRDATLRMAGVLAGLGHEVFAQDPDYGLIGLTFLPRGSSGVAEWSTRVPDAKLERATRFEIKMGRALRGRPLVRARRLEARYQAKIGRIFDNADVLLTPTNAQMPLAVGALSGKGWWNSGQKASKACPYCWPWNVIGWPGLNVPAGFSASGLPIGVQLLGRDSDEATLLALAAQLEMVERWTERRPQI
jgi:amidase